eukprot:1157598-Pelagomonas_calceolata.AAC.3
MPQSIRGILPAEYHRTGRKKMEYSVPACSSGFGAMGSLLTSLEVVQWDMGSLVSCLDVVQWDMGSLLTSLEVVLVLHAALVIQLGCLVVVHPHLAQVAPEQGQPRMSTHSRGQCQLGCLVVVSHPHSAQVTLEQHLAKGQARMSTHSRGQCQLGCLVVVSHPHSAQVTPEQHLARTSKNKHACTEQVTSEQGHAKMSTPRLHA